MRGFLACLVYRSYPVNDGARRRCADCSKVRSAPPVWYVIPALNVIACFQTRPFIMIRFYIVIHAIQIRLLSPRNQTFFKKTSPNIWSIPQKLLTLHPLRHQNGSRQQHHHAEIAQLVEHNLAKVGVASSSLVFRSHRSKSSHSH